MTIVVIEFCINSVSGNINMRDIVTGDRFCHDVQIMNFNGLKNTDFKCHGGKQSQHLKG